jgi:hypothetical protein
MSFRLAAAFAALTAPALLLASVATAQQPPPATAQTPPPAQTPAPPPDPKAVLESACTSCHGLDFITEHRKTRDGWDFTVKTMINRGADLDPDTANLVIDYLAKTYPAEAAPPAEKPPG